MERNNRKSHLAPQLSPSTQDLLRGGSDSPTTVGTVPSSQPTPTSGKLPLSNSSSNLASQPQSQSQSGNGSSTMRSPRVDQDATMAMGNLSLGRSSGQAYQQQHSGMRMAPTRSQSSQQVQMQMESPIERTPSAVQREQGGYRQAPAGPLPPPPPGKDGMFDPRRQQSYPPQNGYAQQLQQPQNGYYGSTGFRPETERQWTRDEQNGRGYRDDRY